MSRPKWPQYFIGITKVVATRSTCISRQVGAVITSDNDILATGYNGAPSGIKHCEVTGCLRKELKVESGTRHELCRGLHAEQNAIISAAKHGVNINGTDIYCTNSPCGICAKMIINAGIKRVFYLEEYNDVMTFLMFEEANIECILLPSMEITDEISSYK